MLYRDKIIEVPKELVEYSELFRLAFTTSGYKVKTINKPLEITDITKYRTSTLLGKKIKAALFYSELLDTLCQQSRLDRRKIGKLVDKWYKKIGKNFKDEINIIDRKLIYTRMIKDFKDEEAKSRVKTRPIVGLVGNPWKCRLYRLSHRSLQLVYNGLLNDVILNQYMKYKDSLIGRIKLKMLYFEQKQLSELLFDNHFVYDRPFNSILENTENKTDIEEEVERYKREKLKDRGAKYIANINSGINIEDIVKLGEEISNETSNV